MKKTFYALKEGHILGAYRKVGDAVGELDDGQAKYLVLARHITDEAPKKERVTKRKSRQSGGSKAD